MQEAFSKSILWIWRNRYEKLVKPVESINGDFRN